MYHTPEHFDGPNEKGKILDKKTKLLMTTVRETVLGILRGEEKITLKKYRETPDWNSKKKLEKKVLFDFAIPTDIKT